MSANPQLHLSTIIWQRVEAALVFVAGIALFWHLNDGLSWWCALLLFFAPDLSFFGYLFDARVGAVCYNLAHVYAVGALLLAWGIGMGIPILGALGALCLAHCGFDRMLGYGLKSPQGFRFTHLGVVGR
jgi:hypothetical protein